MVVCSPCAALIERAKLTIDLILTSITAHTLPACLPVVQGAPLPQATARGRATRVPAPLPVWPLCMQTHNARLDRV